MFLITKQNTQSNHISNQILESYFISILKYTVYDVVPFQFAEASDAEFEVDISVPKPPSFGSSTKV